MGTAIGRRLNRPASVSGAQRTPRIRHGLRGVSALAGDAEGAHRAFHVADTGRNAALAGRQQPALQTECAAAWARAVTQAGEFTAGPGDVAAAAGGANGAPRPTPLGANARRRNTQRRAHLADAAVVVGKTLVSNLSNRVLLGEAQAVAGAALKFGGVAAIRICRAGRHTDTGAERGERAGITGPAVGVTGAARHQAEVAGGEAGAARLRGTRRLTGAARLRAVTAHPLLAA